MPPMERQINSEVSEEERQGMTVSRRQLLKALIAGGGGIAASTLLRRGWIRPIIEMGVLPAHAQASPTPTPELIAIIGCYTLNAAGGGNIGPTDTIHTYAEIAPALSGIQLRRTITLNEVSHPQNGVVDVTTGPTDASGRFEPADFDLGTLTPTISPGEGRLTVLWEFVNPAQGTNTCQNIVDIVEE